MTREQRGQFVHAGEQKAEGREQIAKSKEGDAHDMAFLLDWNPSEARQIIFQVLVHQNNQGSDIYDHQGDQEMFRHHFGRLNRVTRSVSG